MLTPLVRLVSSRIRSLNRSTAFGAMRRFGMPALMKLNPRVFLAHGRATALFCWFTELELRRDESRKAFQGVLSPLLGNVVLDELDRELEQRGHRFVRSADDSNIYVRSRTAGQRVMESVTAFLTNKGAEVPRFQLHER